MGKEKAVYFGILVSIFIVGALVVLGLKNAEAINDGLTYFFTGSTKEDPFCFSWAPCPSVSNPGSVLISEPRPASAPELTLAPEPTPQKPTPTTVPTPVPTATPEPALEPTPTPTATPEPEAVLMAFPFVDPPTHSIPEQQFNKTGLVQWVDGDKLYQGYTITSEYNEEEETWVYKIKRTDGVIEDIEEKQMAWVGRSVLPSGTSIIEKEVKAYDLKTGDLIGAGVVTEAEENSEGWAYTIRSGSCQTLRIDNVRLIMADDLPLRCLPTMVQGEESSAPPAGGGSPMPTELPEDSEIPTVTPTPAPNPVRQFNEGDIVRWVSGGGWINEGQVQSAELAPDTNRWVYDVLRADKSTWKNLEENRMSLVVDGVSPPYQPRVEGLPVRAYQLGTDIVVAEGIVVSREQRPEGWMYNIRQADCEIYQTEPGVRTLLIESLTEPVDCDEDGSTPVPTPTPTPTPEPDDPTPTPATEPTEEDPTPTPTPTPGPKPQHYSANLTVDPSNATEDEYAYSLFVVQKEMTDTAGSNYITPGLVATHESTHWFVATGWGGQESDPDEPAYTEVPPNIQCVKGDPIWETTAIGSPVAGCLGADGELTGDTGEQQMEVSRYYEDGIPHWEVSIEHEGETHLLATIDSSPEEDGERETQKFSGASCNLMDYPPSEYADCEPPEKEFYDPIIVSNLGVNEFTESATGSATYNYANHEILIEIASSGEFQIFRPGLVHTREGDTHWYVTSSDWSGNPAAGVVECVGQEAWGNGCLGDANHIVSTIGIHDLVFDFRVSPVESDSWEVEISEDGETWHKMATFEASSDQGVDHSKDYLDDWTDTGYSGTGCDPLLESPPRSCPDDDFEGEDG